MSRNAKKHPPKPIESESEEEVLDNSTINDSNVVNSTQDSSVESIEIPGTDDELEQSGAAHEISHPDESHEEGRSFIDESAQESRVESDISNAAAAIDDDSDESTSEDQMGISKHKKILNQIVDSDSEEEEHPVSEHEQSQSENSEGEEEEEESDNEKSFPKPVLIKEEAVSFKQNEESGDSESSEEEVIVKKRLSIAQKRQSIAHKRRSLLPGLVDPDTSDEEEAVVERRRTLYKEQPEGDLEDPVEDQAYSRATRRSIFGAPTIKEEAVSFDKVDPDESNSEDDIIISDSEDETAEKENFNKRTSQLSSTLRSPLKDETNSLNSSREASAMNVSPVNSSAAGSSRDASRSVVSPTESPNDSSLKPVRVSRAVYEEACRMRDSISNKMKSADRSDLYAALPDKGAKLKSTLAKMKEELDKKNAEIKNMVIDEEDSISNRIKRSMHEESSLVDIDESNHDMSGAAALPTKPTNYLNADDVKPKYVGKVGMKNFLNAKSLTVEALQAMHKTLDDRPADDALADPPKYLKVDLMKHQLHAIEFMMWRESQKPRGGILADDMGLGKTLTAIALVLKQQQLFEEKDSDDESEDEERSEWISQGRKDLRDGGTLIVCPASLINQWEHEIKSKVKRGALDVCVFHGPKRPPRARELAKFDVVITTYQILVSENKNGGCVYDLRWDRIVLDEGHVVRNHKSQQNEAVCALEAKHRWVLTGTPVHNKEFDMYAVIKFLRISPFDDVTYWKQFIEVKGATAPSPRLLTLLKSILLRRTKTQLMESGEIDSLPEKSFEEIMVTLNPEEKKVYLKMMAYSQAVFANYLTQQQDKHDDWTYDRTQLHRVHSQMARKFNIDREIKASDILTLLLRLRQVCCHPGLIKKALDNLGLNEEEVDGMDASANESGADLLQQFQELQIADDQGKVVTIDDQVYNMDIPSSKLEKLMEIIREKLEKTSDKIIIVSQWVSYLDIIKNLLEFEGVDVCEISGRVPVKKRNDIVVDFNSSRSKIRVMMLSITAGGVGLNLVGANNLFILDPHWNPQIEQQAQDRIYRFGQKKNVKVTKFICTDTIEERVVKLQKTKMDIATSTLTGAKRSATKLTLNDLKELFGMGDSANNGGALK